MIGELRKLDALGDELARRARAAGVLLIWRAQARSVRRILVRKGRAESSSVSSGSGHGIQVVTPEGRVTLGSRDDFHSGPALSLLDGLVGIAKSGAALGLERNVLPDLEPLRASELPGNPEASIAWSYRRRRAGSPSSRRRSPVAWPA